MVETTDMLVELKVPAADVIQLYLETAHVTLQADIDAGMSLISIQNCCIKDRIQVVVVVHLQLL